MQMNDRALNIRGQFDSNLYYQTVKITATAEENEYDITLDEAFDYCDGVMFDSRDYQIFWGLSDKGEWIVDKIPALYTSPGFSKTYEGQYLNIKTVAKKSTKRIYLKIPASDVGNTYQFIFRLTNNKPLTHNKKFYYFPYDKLGNQLELDVYLKKSVSKIIGLSLVVLSGLNSNIVSVSSGTRTYLKDYPIKYLAVTTQADVSNRLLKIDIPNNQFTFIVDDPYGNSGGGYCVIEYEEYKPHGEINPCPIK